MNKVSGKADNRKQVNLMIIAYYFPPSRVVGAIRLFYFYTCLKAILNRIAVLSTSNQRYMQQDQTLILQDAEIIYAPTIDARRWILNSKKMRMTETGNGKSSSWYLFLRRLANIFPLSILTADGGIFYILNGYRSGKHIVRDQHITHILSSYRPYADHCIAYLLKRKFPDLVWVADYRDLPLSLPGWKGDTYPWSKWERGLLSKADLITTVSEGLRKAFEPLGNRILVVRNGVDDKYYVERPVSTDRFLIQYTGSLYPNKQDPSLLFRVLQKMVDSGDLPVDKFLIRYVGPHAHQWQEWLIKYSLPEEVIAVVSRHDSLQMQKQAHLNILLTWAGSGQHGIMTAKLGEYLAARRPILCLIKGQMDVEMQTIVRTYNQGLTLCTAQDEANALALYIKTTFGLFDQNPAHPFFTNDRKLNALYWQTQLEALGEFIVEKKPD